MGGGAAPGARVAAAGRGQQRPEGGGERAEAPATEAAEDPRGAGSRSANSAGLTGARPSLAAAAALRVPPIAPAWKLPSFRPAGRRQHPSPGPRAPGRKGGGGGRRGATPRGSQQWCATLGRSPRPPCGRRGSGRETPPVPRPLSLPEFARLASRAGAPARQRPGRLSPEHGAGARLALIALLPPPLAPPVAPVPPVPPAGAASGFSARGSYNSLLLHGDWPVTTRQELGHWKASPEQPENVHPEQIQEGQRDHSRV